MTPVELENLITHTQALKAETQTLELKAAAQGCPSRLTTPCPVSPTRMKAGYFCSA